MTAWFVFMVYLGGAVCFFKAKRGLTEAIGWPMSLGWAAAKWAMRHDDEGQR